MKKLIVNTIQFILGVCLMFVIVMGLVLFLSDRSTQCHSEPYVNPRVQPKRRTKIYPADLLQENFDLDHRTYVQGHDPVEKNYNLTRTELSDIVPPQLSYTDDNSFSHKDQQYADRVRTVVQSNTEDAINQTGHVPLPSHAQYLPNEMPEVLDPSIVHYQNNLPVVELSNRQYNAADPFRGDIPIKFHPGACLVGKSRFDRDSLRLDGYFSPGSDAKIHKLGNMKTRLATSN
jgi:hypothetical protein